VVKKSDKSDRRKTAGHTASKLEGWDGWLGEYFRLGEHGTPVSPRGLALSGRANTIGEIGAAV